MAEKQYINPKNPVYFSYYKADDKCSDIEESVKKICAVLDTNGICYKRNSDSDIPYCASLDEIQRETGRGALVIVIISKGYIESLDCMHEWHRIRENGKIWERVLPVVLDDAKLRDKEVFMDYCNYFCKRKEVLIKQQSEDIIPLTKSETNAAEFGYYVEDLKSMYKYLADTNYRFDDYSAVVNRIKELLTNKEVKGQQKSYLDFCPLQNLVSRVEIEDLYILVSNNQFSQIYGLGGSGKTSLVSLMLQKYRNEFGQIAYIFVNNKIKDDIVSQINAILKLELPEYKKQYGYITSFLESKIVSSNNLMILDINSTDFGDIRGFVLEMMSNTLQGQRLYANGWKYLFVSRESVYDDLPEMSLNATGCQDSVFLKTIFINKAGKCYADFADFDELFSTLYYNPLLIEQLGVSLKKLPKKTLPEINILLGKDEFYSRSRVGVTIQNRGDEENTIIGFLCNITIFNSFSNKEQVVLRHFVIWPTDFVDKNVIFKLLEGVFDIPEDLNVIIDNLVSRGILTFSEENHSVQYKLHGLIAESIRKQINIGDYDYEPYIANVKFVIGYSYWDFVPFARCIGCSFANFNICTDYKLLRKISGKIRDSFVLDYSISLYQKVLSYISAKLETMPGSIRLNNDLADIYNEIAKLQENYLFDYENAHINYLKVFEIMDKLPLSDMQMRNNMVVILYNFAEFQLYRLNDYCSSELYFKKAIELGSILPRDNDTYQNNNALAYMKMGLLYHRFLKKYSDAEYCYNKAVSIRIIMSDTQGNCSSLACVYLDLALLYCDCLKNNNLSLEYFIKAISMFESLHTDEPSCNKLLAGAYRDLALFYEKKLNNRSVAKTYFNKSIELSEKLPIESPFLYDLAWTYLSYANVEDNVDVCFDCYSKAISIFEKLPISNKEYWDSLAASYYKFAIFITKKLKQYSWAEHYFMESIKIYSQLSCIDSESQFNLAQVYNNLAVLQYSYLEDIDSAKNNYMRAVEISEKLLCKDSTEIELLKVVYNGIINICNELGVFDGVAKYVDRLALLGG